ncbi:MAG TPA: hypothetical protein DCM87_07320 [Planctomycetes bacterium]|nr:hypothetical protein [Planctomycetota bacterium]
MRKAIVAGALVGVLGAVCSAAQIPGPEKFAYWVESNGAANAVVAPGGTVQFMAYMKIMPGDWAVQGWSVALCHDGAVVQMIDPFPDNPTARASAMVAGTNAATVKSGGEPSFNTITVYPNAGVTQGVVIDMMVAVTLPPTDRFSMLKADYRAIGAAGATATLTFCEGALGTPIVENVVVVEGNSISPAVRTGGTITIQSEPLIPTIAAIPAAADLRADKAATGDVKVEIGLAEGSKSIDLQGWSYGLAHDNAKLALVDAQPSATVAALNGGQGPDFYSVNKNPAGGAGVAVAAVVGMAPPFNVIALAGGQKVHTETMTYRSAVELLQANGDQPVDTKLTIVSEVLGDPPVAAVISVDEEGIEFAQKTDGTIRLMPVPAGGVLRKFRRGDANNDSIVNIADGVWILSYAFRGGRVPPCKDAADANDDGKIDQSDAILVIYYQLLNGPAPKAPFPACGTDPSDTSSDSPEDGLNCLVAGNGCA